MTRKSAFGHAVSWTTLVLLGTLGLAGCNTRAGGDAEALSFEKGYVKTINYESEGSIKLIGFKKITIPHGEIEAFDAAYESRFKNTNQNYLWDKATGILTAYFPVESALVEAGDNSIFEASPLGELALDSADSSSLSLSVIGRRQTDAVTGVYGNIIKDGVIYLATRNAAIRHFDQVFVFDFGVKHMGAEHDGSGSPTVEGGVSCLANHGGRNCSRAFGIYMGRCPFNPNVCMDYNGWFTNCQNGSALNFPGSDCDYALGAGHCWNELM